MIKRKSLLLLLLLMATFCYGQNITFEKNISYAAQQLELVQKLNKTGDSLIIISKKEPISQVDILNDDYLETIDFNSNSATVGLKNLPSGEYVIQARIDNHWIVMHLEKEKNRAVVVSDTEVKKEMEKIEKASSEPLFKENTMYWVVYENNAQFASKKTMGLKQVHEIKDLISKMELELKTEYGKNNRLLVYEIYNKSKFIRKQFRNRDYYQRKRSKFFNVDPLYNSDDEERSMPRS